MAKSKTKAQQPKPASSSSRPAQQKPRRTAESQKDLKIMEKVVRSREGLYKELAKH